MNAEVEQRIVEMRFDNEQFEKGAKQTLKTLEKLDAVLDILGEGSMDHLSAALENMEYRFSRLGIAGSAAIQNITGKVMNLASNLLTAIPDQIIQGGTQRALNIENAKFQLKGLGIAWEEVADDIDHAVMGTAYGVDEAAKAAAILGASNVEYKNMAGEISDMGHVLRSISGIAAMTNSSYDDIANVMGDIFAMGRVTNGELQRFELRGLNVVAKLAEMSQNGTLKKIGSDAKYTETELRELIQKGGMDALTFAKAMDAAFGEHATAANETYTGSLRNMKAALSRIGADFVTPFHEGERKVMLSLRGAFDRIRKITKPFAEGPFTKIVETLSDKLTKLIDSTQFGWLEKFVKLTEKINPQPITDFMDKLIGINNFLFNNRTGVGTVSELLDKLEKIDISHLMPSNDSLTKAEKLKQLAKELYRLYVEREEAPDTVRDYLYSNGYIDDLSEAEKVAKVAYNALNRLAPTFSKNQFEWLIVLKDNLKSIIPALSSVKNLFSGILSSQLLKTIGINTLLTASATIRDIANGSKSAIDWLIQKFPVVEDFLLTLFLQLDSTYKAGKQIAGAVIRLGGAVFRVLFAIFEKLGQKLKSPEIFHGYRDAIWKLSDATVSVIDKITEFVNKLADLIEKGPSAESSLGKIGSGFEIIGGFIGGAINGVSTFLRYILGLQEGETIFSKFGGILRTVGGTIRTVFADIRTAIQGAFGEGGVGKEAIKIATGLYTVLIGYRKIESKKFAFGRFSKAFEFLRDLLTKSYESIRAINPLQWADDIETLLRRTSGALRAFADNLNAKSLLTIAGAVVALSVGLTILAAVAEGGHLVSALGALAATMGLLVAALWAIKAVTDQGLFKNITKGWKGLFDVFKNSISKYFNALALKETATALLLFAAAVGVLVVAVGIMAIAFKKLGSANVWQAVGAIVVLSAVLVGALWALTAMTKQVGMFDSTKYAMVAVALAGIAVSVVLLAAAVAIIAAATSKFGYGAVWSAVGAITALGIVIAGLTIALSTFAKNPFVILSAAAMVAVAISIGILTAALLLVSGTIALFGNGTVWSAIGALAALAVILTGVTVALSAFASNPMVIVAAASMIGIAVAIGILSLALGNLAIVVGTVGNGAVWSAVGAIAVGVIVLAGALAVLSLLGPKLLIAALAIVGVGFAIKMACEGFEKLAEGMVVLSGALNMLPADGSLEILGKGLGKVAGGLGKIAAAGLIFPNNLAEKFEALVPLSSAMTLMSDIDFAPLADKEHGMPAAAKAIKSFGGLFGVGMSMLWGSGGLIAAGPGLLSLGEGLQKLAPGMKAFNEIENPTAIADTLKELAFAVTTLDADSTFGKKDYLPQLADNLTKIASAVGGMSLDQIQAIRSLGSALNDAFTEDTGKATQALQTELNSLQKTLETGSERFIIVARRFPMHIQSGIEDNTSIATNAMKQLLWEIAKEAETEQQKNNWRVIGGNIAIGIANGITSRTSEAANAMRNLASALQTSFTVSLAIKSPSRVFENLAEYVPMGVARGIQNGTPEITAAMTESMAGAMDVLDQYARNAKDMTPQITPVMDMANMRRDFTYADRLLQRSGIGSFSGFSGLTVNGDAISYNMQNRDVVGELKQMSNKINRLGQAIENMQMVLDTGVLVGQLSPGINSELGIMAMREGRQ